MIPALRRWPIVAGAVGALLVPALAASAVVDRIVAVVNNEIILSSDLVDRARPFLPRLEAASGEGHRAERERQLYRELLNKLIAEILLTNQAQKAHITVTDEEVERALRNVARENRLTEPEFLDALRQQGTTLPEYREELRRELLRYQVLNARVRGKIRMSDDEIREFYNQSVREVRARDRFHAAWILVRVPAGAGATLVAARRAVAQDLLRRARAGESFGDLARQHSEAADARESGGDLGWRGRGTLAAAVDAALLDLEDGEVAGPVRTPEGFYVVKLLEREASGVRPFREVRDEIARQMLDREMQRQEQIWLQELRRRAFIRIYFDE